MTNQDEIAAQKAFDEWVKEGWHQVFGPNGEITYEKSTGEGKPSTDDRYSLTAEVTDFGSGGWGGTAGDTGSGLDLKSGQSVADDAYDETSMMKAFHQLAISAVMGPQTLSAVEDENAEDNSNDTG